jgi:hypothetical protein
MKTVMIQRKTSDMRKVFYDPKVEIVKKQEVLLTTFAKGYYFGGGWWMVSGYHYAGKDVDDIISKL